MYLSSDRLFHRFYCDVERVCWVQVRRGSYKVVSNLLSRCISATCPWEHSVIRKMVWCSEITIASLIAEIGRNENSEFSKAGSYGNLGS